MMMKMKAKHVPAFLGVLAAILFVPFLHHLGGPAPVLQSIAGFLEPYLPPAINTMSSDAAFDSAVFNAAGFHLPEGGLTLEQLTNTKGTTAGKDLHRLVRNTRKQGAFYFEGWYYKFVTADTTRSIAIIPGVLLNEKEEYGFVMVVNPKPSTSTNTSTDTVAIHRYPLSEVVVRSPAPHAAAYESALDRDFFIQIGPNTFTRDSIELHIAPQTAEEEKKNAATAAGSGGANANAKMTVLEAWGG